MVLMETFLIAGFFALSFLLYVFFTRSSAHREEKAKQSLADVSALGDDLVPTSIYPKVDMDRCIGSGACVQACPEHDVIGLIGGRGKLVNPLGCVGHGACAASCPMDAIELVFGTAKRGVELPSLDETFETSLEGVYVVGELGGMGLIRNAIRQGAEVGDYIAEARRKGGHPDILDAIVVGAGPAGISATLSIMEHGLSVKLLEGDAFGGTIAHYPRSKVVMTGPIMLRGRSKLRRRTMSKEELMELWEDVRTSNDLPLIDGQLVTKLESVNSSWKVFTEQAVYQAANVVLALGRRGSPRKLGVPGEELQKVAYRLLEPDPFRSKHVLVVGGGNSAAECAIALADDGQCLSVGISYRRAEFARLRAQVRERLNELIEAGAIDAHMQTQVVQIGANDVHLSSGQGETLQLPNDAMIVQIGGTPPSALLSTFGISTVEKFGEA